MTHLYAGALAGQPDAIALTIAEAARLQSAEAMHNGGENDPHSFASRAFAIAQKNAETTSLAEMRAIPVTAEIARLLQSAEDIAGFGTDSPGSVARHAQSAAARNEQ